MSHPSIVVLSGAEAGAVLNIDEVLNNFVIGSGEGCHLALSGHSVSPLHASVFLDDEGQVTISDTNSSAGVFVNGERVTEQVLMDGDEICLGSPDDQGSDRLRFSAQGADAPLIDLSESGDLSLPGLDGLEPAPSAEPLFTSELGRPDFEALPGVETALPEEFAPVEMFSEPEPAPLPAPVPPPAAAPRPAPRAVPTKAAPGAPSKSVGPARGSAKRDDGDPLSGLAESLGGSSGERFQPPPAVIAPPVAAGGFLKFKASPPVMAARLAVVAVVLGGLAWFGTRKYSESIVVPVVDKYLPNPAEPGQNVTISGSGFGTDPDPTVVKVMLGEVEVPALDANPTRINITIPESFAAAGSQTLSLTVTAQGTRSTSRLLKIAVPPKITSLTPRVALSGDEVVINGKWLANPKVKPTVTVAGNEAEILEATAGSIRIRIPAVSAIEGQKVSVRVALGPDIGKEAPLNFGRLPFVDAVSPARALPAEVVTIAGLGLAAPGVSVVVGGKAAVILSATESEIKASVPGIRLSEGAGRRDLTVHAGEKSSIALPLEILRVSSALYTPRFFAEVIEGERVAVSCELGPVMVLGNDVASHKRAHDAAVKLNALVAQGRTSRMQFGATDVTVTAPGGPLLALAAGDGSGNPRALASVWAAHLTDMFDLFLQGRRPGRTVEISPDGKVFLDIFAAARRRSAEAGVAPGVLSSPDPAWLRSLASLAIAPVMGSGQALALLDGYWAGVIEVPGAIQPRKIEISLTALPSGLIGQRTSRQGKLSTDVSLQGLSYGRRELRFSFADSGENLSYRGVLDGDEIDGNVTRASGARVGRLRFKLTR